MKLNPIGSNMTEVLTPTKKVLFSYQTPVAAYDSDLCAWYKTDKFWSVTTSRHINKWFKTFGNSNVNAAEKPQEFFDSLVA